jgi:hypothetical protein
MADRGHACRYRLSLASPMQIAVILMFLLQETDRQTDGRQFIVLCAAIDMQCKFIEGKEGGQSVCTSSDVRLID